MTANEWIYCEFLYNIYIFIELNEGEICMYVYSIQEIN